MSSNTIRVRIAVAMWQDKKTGEWKCWCEGAETGINFDAKDSCEMILADTGVSMGQPLHWRHVEADVPISVVQDIVGEGKVEGAPATDVMPYHGVGAWEGMFNFNGQLMRSTVDDALDQKEYPNEMIHHGGHHTRTYTSQGRYYGVFTDYKGRGFWIFDLNLKENLSGPLRMNWRDEEAVLRQVKLAHASQMDSPF